MSPPPPPPPAASDALPKLSISFTTEVMVGIFIVFFFLSLLFLFHILCRYHYLGANHVVRNLLPRFILTPLPRRALDPDVLKSLPVTIVSSAEFKDWSECTICLSDLTEGEKARRLPCCRHGFHLECIDMWFGSNSTCPICRRLVESKNVILGGLEQSYARNEGELQQGIVVSVDKSGEGSSSSVGSGSRKSAGFFSAIA